LRFDISLYGSFAVFAVTFAVSCYSHRELPLEPRKCERGMRLSNACKITKLAYVVKNLALNFRVTVDKIAKKYLRGLLFCRTRVDLAESYVSISPILGCIVLYIFYIDSISRSFNRVFSFTSSLYSVSYFVLISR